MVDTAALGRPSSVAVTANLVRAGERLVGHDSRPTRRRCQRGVTHEDAGDGFADKDPGYRVTDEDPGKSGNAGVWRIEMIRHFAGSYQWEPVERHADQGGGRLPLRE